MTRKPKDFDLWLEVTKSIRPLRSSAAVPPAFHGRPTPSSEPKVHPPKPSAPHAHVVPHPYRSIPHLTGFDRRTAQRMTRGQVEIERRLDLHGTGIEMARVRLLQFLRTAQAEGLRTALVITGKGDSQFSRHTLHGAAHYHAPERSGRLRQLVPDWLTEPEFSTLVIGFQPAHPKHGGGGAFYVKLRRHRQQP